MSKRRHISKRFRENIINKRDFSSYNVLCINKNFNKTKAEHPNQDLEKKPERKKYEKGEGTKRMMLKVTKNLTTSSQRF